MMSDRPNVNVIYQDSKQPATMGCLELAVSLAVLAIVAVAITGRGLWDLFWWLLFGG